MTHYLLNVTKNCQVQQKYFLLKTFNFFALYDEGKADTVRKFEKRKDNSAQSKRKADK